MQWHDGEGKRHTSSYRCLLTKQTALFAAFPGELSSQQTHLPILSRPHEGGWWGMRQGLQSDLASCHKCGDGGAEGGGGCRGLAGRIRKLTVLLGVRGQADRLLPYGQHP